MVGCTFELELAGEVTRYIVVGSHWRQHRRFGCADVLREAAARSEAAAQWWVGGVRTLALELDRARRLVGIALQQPCSSVHPIQWEDWSRHIPVGQPFVVRVYSTRSGYVI